MMTSIMAYRNTA